MSWRIARSLQKLREQINAEFPKRDKSSDGSIGDAAHASRNSDHNPWVKDASGVGVVTAIDIDEDLNGGRTLENIITAIRASRDKRVKYIIYEGRITVQGSDLQSWKKYSGTNSHSHHAHISVNSAPHLYDDESDWSIDGTTEHLPVNPPVSLPLLKRGMEGPAVRDMQTRLTERGFAFKIDGIFGPTTERIVKAFQAKNGLTPDGIVGEKTWEALS